MSSIGAEFIPADVRRVADCQRLVDSAVERFGRLDILVNNAGVFDFRERASHSSLPREPCVRPPSSSSRDPHSPHRAQTHVQPVRGPVPGTP
ncbi:SDR family oxidoreductase [Streptomyces sp. NPDC055105]|uniref:SDR family oxidoreductase n=1 Tax=Streptomyces sp. NPDC055105 TaxID=3365719 RepID=UPI0037CDBF55